jgi:vacuolar-type H+-ATPase subunit H
MAENTSEIDAINHLLEVEKNASALINDAAQEVDRRLSDARAKYNAEYKSRYDEIAAKLEAEYQENHQKVAEKYQKEIEDYKESLTAKPQNSEAFSSLLDKLIFS